MAHPITLAALIAQLVASLFHPLAVHPSRPAIPCTIGPPPLGASDHLAAPMARWTLTVAKSGETICGWKRPGAKQ